jgi:hypothetical protein
LFSRYIGRFVSVLCCGKRNDGKVFVLKQLTLLVKVVKEVHAEIVSSQGGSSLGRGTILSGRTYLSVFTNFWAFMWEGYLREVVQVLCWFVIVLVWDFQFQFISASNLYPKTLKIVWKIIALFRVIKAVRSPYLRRLRGL